MKNGIPPHWYSLHVFIVLLLEKWFYRLGYSAVLLLLLVLRPPQLFSVLCIFRGQVQFLHVSLHVILPSRSWSSPASFAIHHSRYDAFFRFSIALCLINMKIIPLQSHNLARYLEKNLLFV